MKKSQGWMHGSVMPESLISHISIEDMIDMANNANQEIFDGFVDLANRIDVGVIQNGRRK